MAATVGCATGGDRWRNWWWRWWFSVAGDVVFLLSLSPLFFVLFSASFFFSSFGLPSLFSYFSSLFFVLSRSVFFSFFPSPPFCLFSASVFIRREGR
jgi:hypothetical protein